MWRMRWRFIQCIDCMFYFYDVCHNIIWCETVCRLYVFIFLTCFMTLYGVLTVWFISVTCVDCVHDDVFRCVYCMCYSVTCVMTLSSMSTVCVTLWRVSSVVAGVLRGQQLHGVRRAAGRSPAQLLQGLRHSHRPRPLMDAALQGLSQNSKPYPSTYIFPLDCQ